MPGGGQKGNTNAARGTEWRDAIRAVVKQYEKGDIKRKTALRKIAETLIEKAIAGDMAAIKELGDRLDGKSGQSVQYTGEVDLRTFPVCYIDPEPREDC